MRPLIRLAPFRLLLGGLALSLLPACGSESAVRDGDADASQGEPDRGPPLRDAIVGDSGAPADAGASDATPDTDAAPGADAGSGQPDGGGLPPKRLLIPTPDPLPEEELAEIPIGFDTLSTPPHIYVFGLPPGAHWDYQARVVRFTPDFTQGGGRWTVRVFGFGDFTPVEGELIIEVADTIQPPAPEVVDQTVQGPWTRLVVRQRTDDFLGRPDEVGRTYNAHVMAPTDADHADPRPVRIMLHGFAGGPTREGWEGEYRIAPHDPDNTYWWGEQDGLPGVSNTQPYTLRRTLHLLKWVLDRYPGADPQRVYIEGASMGGAGAATLGLMWARHFAYVQTTISQWIPRNHRPSRIRQLQSLWGDPSGEVWGRMDLTRVMERPEAQRQAFFIKHGKDDPIIHFGAMVRPSPDTSLTVYAALQQHRIGHLAVWDEGGHGPADPVLGEQWWTHGWNPIFDDTARLRRDEAFPAFTRCSVDNDPGDGSGNGSVPWSDESGFSADFRRPGDTGWSGDIAGAINRPLRWDSNGILDAFAGFEIPLIALDGEGGDPPRAGYPTTGDRLDGTPPVIADVTLRRVQAFKTHPNQPVQWRFGDAEGIAVADERGVLTIPALPIQSRWQTLRLSKVP